MNIVRRRRRPLATGADLGLATDRDLALALLDGRSSTVFPLGLPADRVTTPFEAWCEQSGIHPEALGAWEQFHRAVTAAS